MVLGVHPFSSCFLLISPSKVVQKFGATLIRMIARTVTYLSPYVPEDDLQLHLWLKIEYQVLYYDITMHIACTHL